MICWTLGHHRAPQRGRQRPRADLPLAADRPRRASTAAASTRCAARTTSRAAATWARCPTGCPASSTSRTTSSASKCEAIWERARPAEARLAPVGHVRGDGPRRAHRAVRDRREPAAVRGRPPPDRAAPARPRPARRPGHLPDRDRARSPTSCSRPPRPGPRARARSRTRERRVQRVRKALEPPGEARDDLWIIFELARRLGHDWGEASAEAVWNEVRAALAGPRAA